MNPKNIRKVVKRQSGVLENHLLIIVPILVNTRMFQVIVHTSSGGKLVVFGRVISVYRTQVNVYETIFSIANLNCIILDLV